MGRKRVSVQVDDDDYVPAIGEDDGDDESSTSLNNEVLYIWFGACDISYFVILWWNNFFFLMYDTDGTRT